MKGAATSFRRTSFFVQTKILYCETTITNKIPFWRQKLSQFVRNFFFKIKPKMRDVLGKMRECGKYVKMRDFPHDCGMVDTYDQHVVMSSSYFTFLNFKKNIRINIFITIQYLKHFELFGSPLIFPFLVLSVHIPLVVLHI